MHGASGLELLMSGMVGLMGATFLWIGLLVWLEGEGRAGVTRALTTTMVALAACRRERARANKVLTAPAQLPLDEHTRTVFLSGRWHVAPMSAHVGLVSARRPRL